MASKAKAQITPNLLKLDLYELLAVNFTADDKEIKKAYRKKALTCHPDKNPDNPRAAEIFQELTSAFEVLTNAKLRSHYDTVLKARKAASIRRQKLNAERKKIKDDLDERERIAAERQAEEVFTDEVERLQKEGSALLEAEQAFLREQIRREKEEVERKREAEDARLRAASSGALPKATFTCKVRWRQAEGGVSESDLRSIYSPAGRIESVTLLPSKPVALIEFSSLYTTDPTSMVTDLTRTLPTLKWVGTPPTLVDLTCFPAPPTQLSTKKMRGSEDDSRSEKELIYEQQPSATPQELMASETDILTQMRLQARKKKKQEKLHHRDMSDCYSEHNTNSSDPSPPKKRLTDPVPSSNFGDFESDVLAQMRGRNSAHEETVSLVEEDSEEIIDLS